MKIAVMGAMPEEIEPLLNIFNHYKVTEYGNNKYFETSYNGIQIVIAYSKIGKVFATLTASTLIEKFGCTMLLFTGVAGAVNPSLKIGDLIVASKLCQHDVDITAFGHPHGFIPEGSLFVESDRELKTLAKEVSNESDIKLIEGIIATGDQFIASNSKKEFIYKTFKADAIEMEGAAVAVACNSLNVPFLILRSISDSADMEAEFNFDEFMKSAAINSANFIAALIKKIRKTDAIT